MQGDHHNVVQGGVVQVRGVVRGGQALGCAEHRADGREHEAGIRTVVRGCSHMRAVLHMAGVQDCSHTQGRGGAGHMVQGWGRSEG